MKFDFTVLIRDIVYSENLEELKKNVLKANNFVKIYELSPNSDEYKKIENAILLMKLKLKKSKKF